MNTLRLVTDWESIRARHEVDDGHCNYVIHYLSEGHIVVDTLVTLHGYNEIDNVHSVRDSVDSLSVLISKLPQGQ